MNDLTVCITSFRRGDRLRRCLQSCVDAGISRFSVFSMDPDGPVMDVVREFQKLNHIDLVHNHLGVDLGCNETWLQAVYHAHTERILVMHDDDTLSPKFGEVYQSIIRPHLDRGIKLASWMAHLKYDDGTIRKTEYFTGPTKVYPSSTLRDIVATKGRLSLSPIVSVFDRQVMLSALKESEDCLTHYLHPSMLLGTEVLVYLRHCDAFKEWLFVDHVLAYYGSWPGSGTVKAESAKETKPLIAGYDEARERGAIGSGYTHRSSRILLTYVPYEGGNVVLGDRVSNVKPTWDVMINTGQMIGFPASKDRLHRALHDFGISTKCQYLRDVMDYACWHSAPEDILVYSNLDIAFTLDLPSRLRCAINQSGGVAVVWRRTMDFNPHQFRTTAKQGVIDGGVDMIAVTPHWWQSHRDGIPDVLVGAQHWDWVFRSYAERVSPDCYMSDGIYHSPHPSLISRVGYLTPENAHNLAKAKAFFESLGQIQNVRWLDRQASKHQPKN